MNFPKIRTVLKSFLHTLQVNLNVNKPPLEEEIRINPFKGLDEKHDLRLPEVGSRIKKRYSLQYKDEAILILKEEINKNCLDEYNILIRNTERYSEYRLISFVEYAIQFYANLDNPKIVDFLIDGLITVMKNPNLNRPIKGKTLIRGLGVLELFKVNQNIIIRNLNETELAQVHHIGDVFDDYFDDVMEPLSMLEILADANNAQGIQIQVDIFLDSILLYLPISFVRHRLYTLDSSIANRGISWGWSPAANYNLPLIYSKLLNSDELAGMIEVSNIVKPFVTGFHDHILDFSLYHEVRKDPIKIAFLNYKSALLNYTLAHPYPFRIEKLSKCVISLEALFLNKSFSNGKKSKLMSRIPTFFYRIFNIDFEYDLETIVKTAYEIRSKQFHPERKGIESIIDLKHSDINPLLNRIIEISRMSLLLFIQLKLSGINQNDIIGDINNITNGKNLSQKMKNFLKKGTYKV